VTPDGARPAVLFDVDGTLIDSNYLHAHAWYRAFNGVGLDFDSWRIHRSIGMDGSTLVAMLAEDADDDTREAEVDVAHAVLVGDTVRDVEACGRAGVPTIAVLSGGVSRGELETACAQAIFDNPRDLCDHLDSTAIGRLAEAVQTT
jgi:phosphoglycolate phosphatase-like HAD superfamily hydrolase